MAFFNWFKRKGFFSKKEQERILASIKNAESSSSAELRVYIESHCTSKETLDRASALFNEFQMGNTNGKNAVLIYIAVKDKKYAIFGDAGIYEKLGSEFWNDKVQQFKVHFLSKDLSRALSDMIEEIGQTLKDKFPNKGAEDINELPDDILFGN